MRGSCNSLFLFVLTGVVAAGLVQQAATSSEATEEPTAKPLQWVGLFNDEMIEWLENENRMDVLLQAKAKQAADGLRQELLKPKSWALEVKAEPAEQSPTLGRIEITATPGKGLSARYMDKDGAEADGFTPDLFDIDWGYGPYFHQTVLDHRDTWFRLPKDPLPTPAWIDLSALTDSPSVLTVLCRRVYVLNAESIVIVDSDDECVTLRPEQEGDFFPGVGPKRQTHEPPALRCVPYRDLFTETGHLRLRVKYMRGL